VSFARLSYQFLSRLLLKDLPAVNVQVYPGDEIPTRSVAYF